MKKKFIFLVVGGISLFIHCLNQSNESQKLQDLAFTNIEALAQNEGVGKRYCAGSGSLDCNGYKVRTIIENFGLR